MSLFDAIARRAGYVSREEVEEQFDGFKQSLKRQFSAAQTSRLSGGWDTQPKTLDADIKKGLKALVARSRELAQNDDYIRSYLRLLKNNVVGATGFQFQARALGLDGKPDKRGNQAVEDAWREWCSFGVCDVTGKHSFRSAMNLALETTAKDGECLIRLVPGWARNRSRFAIQFFDSQQLDVNLNVDLKNGRKIKMGIEFDEWDAPAAYLLMANNGSENYQVYSGKKYTRIPADQIIHLFLPEATLQSRGYPWYTVAMLRLKMLGGYEEAELVACRVASSQMGFFERDAEGSGYEGEPENSDDVEGPVEMEAEPGVIRQLPHGVKFSAWDPKHPTAAFKDFVKANLRGVAAGLGVSYFSLAGDLESVNYSSGRLGRLEDQELYKALQNWLIEALCSRIYQQWLLVALASGVITVRGKSLGVDKYSKFLRVNWQGRRWQSADPSKDAKANQIDIAERTKSISEIIRDSGRDPDEVFDEIASDQEKLRERGILPITEKTGGEEDAEDKDEKDN